MSEYDDIPDKTLSELDEEREEDMVPSEEVEKEMGEHRELMEVMMGANILARFLEDDIITLREYMRLVEKIEEYERELDVSVL